MGEGDTARHADLLLDRTGAEACVSARQTAISLDRRSVGKRPATGSAETFFRMIPGSLPAGMRAKSLLAAYTVSDGTKLAFAHKTETSLCFPKMGVDSSFAHG